MKLFGSKLFWLMLIILLCTGDAFAGQDAACLSPTEKDKAIITKQFKKPGYSPYAGRNYPTQVFFGDTHLHTGASGDAFGFGNMLTDEDAFRFARGEGIMSANGQRVRLSRPLDFLVVADHAEAYGAMIEVYHGNPALLKNPKSKRWHDMLNEGGEASFAAVMEMIQSVSDKSLPPELLSPKLFRSIWEKHTALTDSYNEPGVFTAFHGYEWTSHPGGNNLHQVVIFRDAAEKVNQLLPFTAFDSENPEDLWQALSGYEQKTGGSALAIPHNGNLSNGIMFPEINPATNQPLTRAYAEMRMRWEPLIEVTQIKGDGEAHPFLSPNDEFADYETWDKGNLDLSGMKKTSMLQYEYARSAYKLGLKLENKLGANPYKFGMIGSTDAHTALATATEENFFGKHSGKEPSEERWHHPIFDFNGVRIMGWQQAASGYAAVWATENSREAIFDGMIRKEAYATTGSRMIVRFFGGWEFSAEDANTRTPGEVGYQKGVPMGSDLMPAPQGKPPVFLVAARKDPYNGNLDRIQIVKGWQDSTGQLKETVYDVVWSDGRQPAADGKLPPVGNTVDVKNATWTNTIGSPELIAVWRDPDFDPKERAFYYARVIEIPTPRWTAYDALRYGIIMDEAVPMWTQERAYTSPIWYSPDATE